MAEYQAVKQAVREWMASTGHIGTAADLGYRLADDFGISENSRAEHVTFQGQVRRALEQLVDECVLIRNRGFRGYRPEPDYRTPEEDARRRQADQQAAGTAQELREAWDSVHGRIRALGIGGKMAGPVISLDLDSWAQLLEYAERGCV